MKKIISRRDFAAKAVKASLAFTIIPRFVLGGKGFIPPSDKLTVGFIGTGKQGRNLQGSFSKKTQ